LRLRFTQPGFPTAPVTIIIKAQAGYAIFLYNHNLTRFS